MTTITLSFSDLLKLSFGNFELRNMKFRVLYWCLQVISRELKMDTLKIEFKGQESSLMQNEVHSASEEVSNQIKVEIDRERVMNGRDAERRAAQAKRPDEPKGMPKVVVIENGVITKHPKTSESDRSPSSTSLERLEARLRTIQAQVDDIGSKVLPTDEVLLEKVRQTPESQPVTELLQTMKITKRMSGAEEEIDRIASLLEKVALEYSEIKEIMDEIQEDFGQDVNETLHQLKIVSGYIRNIRPREAYYQITIPKRYKSARDPDENIETDEKEFRSPSPSNIRRGSVLSDDNCQDESLNNEDDVKSEGETDQEYLLSHIREREVPESMKKKKKKDKKYSPKDGDHYFEVLEPVPELQLPAEGAKTMSELIRQHEQILESAKTINKLIRQHEQLKLDCEYLAAQMNTLADFAEVILYELAGNRPNIEVLKEKLREIHLRPSEYKKTKCLKHDILKIHTKTCYRINFLEGNMSRHAAKIQLQGDMHDDSLKEIDTRIKNLEREVSVVVMDVNEIKLDDGNDKDEILERLGDKLATLEERIDVININSNSITKDVKSYEAILQRLKDEIFLVKSAKLDRFEFDELLSDKASIVQLNTKLSYDEFTQSYRFLNKSIERTAEKISSQEVLWQNWIDNMQEAIQNKLSLEDFHELSKSLIAQMKKLREELLTMVFAKYGPPARGSKLKYMANLECISCDRDVLMKQENDFPNLPILPRLQPSNIKKRATAVGFEDTT